MNAAAGAVAILVIDDDAVDRMAVRRALARGPFAKPPRVIEAATPEEAQEALGRGGIDCVLLDLQLPGVSGLEILGSIRASEGHPAVIMLTGQGDEQTIVEAMKSGAADYLRKSALEPERLGRSILQAIRTREAELETVVARRRLEVAEQRYRFLADSIPQMVWVLNGRLDVEYVNVQWQRYTGLAIEAMSTETAWDIVHREDRGELARVQAEMRGAGASRVETQVRVRRASDGVHRWQLMRAERLVTVDGEARWFGTWTDIEDQKRAESELTELKDVAERERRRAEESNRAKDDFLAMLSHELRTPLNAIVGWTKLIRASDVSEEVLARGLAVVDRNARTQTQLIEDLLDVSRIVADKLEIDRDTVDLREVAVAAIDTVQPLATSKAIEVRVDLGDEAIVVSGDGARLQQVVWNLLVNAVKFTPNGGQVTLTRTIEGGRVTLAVEDSGVGVDPAFLPFVFDRFRQADASFTRGHGGLGIGLAIVRYIVERHGGEVFAESDGTGRGSRFGFSLSLSERPLSEAPPPSETPRSLTGIDILIVDDDDDGRQMLGMALEGDGATVREVASVAAARAALRERVPDVLLSDIGMPEEDGYALISDVRARPREEGGSVLAIALTGYAGVEDEGRARAAGFDDHLPKPVELDLLSRLISRLLRASKG